MKLLVTFVILAATLISCKNVTEGNKSSLPKNSIIGTWKLISATVIEKNDTVVTNYAKDKSFIKIINDTHFAFLQHDLNKGKDSGAVFSSGGGSYSLKDSIYTERLEYCSAREWEGNDFNFTITLKNDTLVQSGIEKVESAGVDRINIEQYTRVKK